MLTINDFIGTWRTKDFPGCVGNEHGEITLHISGSEIATLWKLEEKRNSDFAIGKCTIQDNEDGSFDIKIDGQVVEEVFSNIEGNLFISNPSPSFISEIPKHGKRYFEKL